MAQLEQRSWCHGKHDLVLSSALCFAALMVFATSAAEIPTQGTVVGATVVPGGSFPTHASAYGHGGWHEVTNIAQRDALLTTVKSNQCIAGMACYVLDVNKLYVLKGSEGSWTWEEFTPGGGAGDSGWTNAGSIVRLVNTSSRVLIGTTSGGSGNLYVYGPAAGTGVYANMGDYAIYGQAASGYGVYGNAWSHGVHGRAVNNGVVGNAANHFGMYGYASNYYGVYGNAANYGVYGYGRRNGGVGGYAAGNNGVCGEAASSFGVYGYAPSYGVYGNARDYGVYGNAKNYGVYANANNCGIYGNAENYGVYANAGDYGMYSYANNYAVFGYARNNNAVYGSAVGNYGVCGAAGENYGVVGSCLGHYGVYGVTVGNYGVFGNACNYGVYGLADNNAVLGFVNDSYGTMGLAVNNYAVYGVTFGNYAVYGMAGGNWGGYFESGGQNALYCGGNLVLKSGNSIRWSVNNAYKAFTIDHPLDPANKVLRHFCVEGPEVWNVYAGNVTLLNGEAVVHLPDYYSKLNLVGSEIYSLTAVGDQAMVFVKRSVTSNHFLVAGTKDIKVSWQVMVKRNDRACIEALRRHPAEESKSEITREQVIRENRTENTFDVSFPAP